MKLFQDVHPNISTLKAIKPEHIETFKAALAKGHKPRTPNEALGALRALVSRAIRLGLYSGPNPFTGVEMLPDRRKAPEWLSAEQMESVMDAATKHSRNALFFFGLCIFAGLRKMEAIMTRWEWIDLQAGLLHVRGSEDFFIKDGEDRTIPLHSRLRAILEPYHESEGYLIAPEKLKLGKHRYRFEISKTFTAVTKAAGVHPWCHPHILRHTFASQLVSAGVELYKVSKWLGHADFATTQIYAHLRPQDPDIERLAAAPSRHLDPERL